MKVTRGSGVVLASYGRGVLVQPSEACSSRTTLRCSLKSRKLRIVCGDRITWVHEHASDGATVESIEPRHNLIERIDARGRPEPVAANIDRLAIVAAPQPTADWFLVDRYWAGARLKDVATLLIVNKADLGLDAIRADIDTYRDLQLPCLEMAANTAEGMDELRAALEGGVTLLVGQSGVGKSSIVNALVPDASAQVAALTSDAEGRHTTTTARRYHVNTHTAIIDAPGVRDFAPPASLKRAAERGFAEIHASSAACRFNDCRHMEEPGCAVRLGAMNGSIAQRRYESYRRLVRLYEDLAPD